MASSSGRRLAAILSADAIGDGGAARRATRRVQAASIVLVGILGALHLVWLAAALGPTTWLPMLSGLFLGALAADLVTGLVHWACDTWGDERTAWVGASLIHSFREHHRYPRAMLEHDWIEVNGAAAVPAAAAFALLSLSASPAAIQAEPFSRAFLWSLIGLGAVANQLHRWAHTRVPPRPILALQRLGLVLSPARHGGHHRVPHTTGYCIATGWLNGVLDGAGFWRALERAVVFITSVPPRAGGGSPTEEA
jgi:ubiquitin-conjugating enzyme E2 variant